MCYVEEFREELLDRIKAGQDIPTLRHELFTQVQ